MEPLETPLAEINPSLLVQNDKRMKMCEKAMGVSYCHVGWSPLGGPAAKNPRGLRPLRFWPLDLPGKSILHDTPSAFPYIVPLYTIHFALHSENWTWGERVRQAVGQFVVFLANHAMAVFSNTIELCLLVYLTTFKFSFGWDCPLCSLKNALNLPLISVFLNTLYFSVSALYRKLNSMSLLSMEHSVKCKTVFGAAVLGDYHSWASHSHTMCVISSAVKHCNFKLTSLLPARNTLQVIKQSYTHSSMVWLLLLLETVFVCLLIYCK